MKTIILSASLLAAACSAPAPQAQLSEPGDAALPPASEPAEPPAAPSAIATAMPSATMPAPTTPTAEDAGPPPSPQPRQLDWSSPTPINPGVETAWCGAVGAPEARERWLTAWHVKLAYAHHTNLWFLPAGTDVTKWCASHDASNLVFDVSQPELTTTPPGAIRIPAGSVMAVDVHELNTSDAPQTVNVHMDLSVVDEQPGPELFPGMLEAEIFSVPAGATQTLTWSCAIPQGAQIVWMSSHCHKHTDRFTIAADGVQVFESLNWADPAQKTFSPPITPKTVSWSSHIVNNTPVALPWGSTVATSEMSNVWLYTLGVQVKCETTKATVQ